MSLHKVSVSAANPRGTLVVLHGFGSNEMDLLGLAQELELPLEIIAFRAPVSLGMGAYAWYNLSFDAQGERHYDEAEALHARELLIGELEKLQGKRIMLAGFSQGCILSLGVGLLRPELVDGLWLMSGAMNPEFVSASVPAGFIELPKLVQHGVSDPVLPIHYGRGIRDFMVSCGAAHEYREYPMAHQVSLMSLRDGQQFVSDWLERE